MLAAPLAGLAAVAAALFAIALLYGFTLLAEWLARVLPNPRILGVHVNIGGVVKSAATHALHGVESLLDAAAGPLYNAIMGPIYTVNNLFVRIGTALANAYVTADWIVTKYVPREIGAVRRWAWDRVAYTRALVASAATAAHKYSLYVWHEADVFTRAMAAEAHTYALHIWHEADAYAAKLFGAAEAYTASEVAKVRAMVNTATGAATSTGAKVLDAAKSFTVSETAKISASVAATAKGIEADIDKAASAALTGAVGVITTDIEHVAATTVDDLGDAIGAVVGVAATDFPDIMAWVKSIPLTKALDVAGVTTMSIATAGALTRYLEECGMPNCRNLGKFGNELSNLGSLIGAAEMIAFLVAAIRNPDSVAREIHDIGYTMASGVSRAFTELL